MTHSNQMKHRIARLVQRFPNFAKFMTMIYRQTRPKFTAGVVGVVVNEQNQVLLVEHVYHADEPWGLPGGWLERNEPPAQGVQREILEETGMEVEIIAPLLVTQRYFRRDHLDIAYLCKPRSDITELSDELLAFEWVNLADLERVKPFHKAAIHAAQAFQLGLGDLR